MSSKSWHLDRRTFLNGAGVACLLPYLEAMEKSTKALAALHSYLIVTAQCPSLGQQNPTQGHG